MLPDDIFSTCGEGSFPVSSLHQLVAVKDADLTIKMNLSSPRRFDKIIPIFARRTTPDLNSTITSLRGADFPGSAAICNRRASASETIRANEDLEVLQGLKTRTDEFLIVVVAILNPVNHHHHPIPHLLYPQRWFS